MRINFQSCTVMHLLRQLDPEGSNARRQHRMIRRVYVSKVNPCMMYASYYMLPALRKGTINFETFHNYYFCAQYVGCTLQCSVVYM